MVRGNVIIDVIISRRSFVFGQSHAKVSAGFTNVSSLAVAAYDLVPYPGGVLPYKRLMGMRRWMVSHFHDIDSCFALLVVCGPLQSFVVNVCTLYILGP